MVSSSGASLQAPLAVVGCIFGLVAWWQTRELGFLVGAVLIIANWPWTLLVIMPTNNALMATDRAHTTPQTRALIVKWGTLHTVRSVLGSLATIAFLVGCIRANDTAAMCEPENSRQNVLVCQCLQKPQRGS